MNSILHIENHVHFEKSFNGNRAIGPKIQSSKRIYKKSVTGLSYLILFAFVAWQWSYINNGKNKKHKKLNGKK